MVGRELVENESKTKFETSRSHVDALSERSELSSRLGIIDNLTIVSKGNK